MMDINKIFEVLPHRYPFLLVDRIIELEEDKRVVGLKNVTINEPFFQGHFPGKPIMPGVLIIEAMAQIGGIMLLTSRVSEKITPYLTGVDKLRVRKPVFPGDQLIIEAKVMGIKGGMGKVKVTATVNGNTVAEGEIMFALVEDK